MSQLSFNPFHPLLRALGVCAVALACLGPPVQPLAAQNTGNVTGEVTSRGQARLSEAQVFVVGTQMGALTASNGRYLIRNVPAGTYQLRAILIGHETATQSVTVPRS